MNGVVSSDSDALLLSHAKKFDFNIDTVSAPHDLNLYLQLLKTNGAMVLVGWPEIPPTIEIGNLIFGRKYLAGSLRGGIPETQEMLDYCGKHNITSDVKYRFLLDMKAL